MTKVITNGPFSYRPVAMLDSPAYRALSLAAHRVLSRIELEHARHSGKDNGKLPVTFEQFEEITDRHSISPAQRELEALGFVKIKHGIAGNGAWRRPSLFRLTYRPCYRGTEPTDDWRRSKTDADAKRIAKEARQGPGSPVGVFTKPSGGFYPDTPKIPAKRTSQGTNSPLGENRGTSRLAYHLVPSLPSSFLPSDGHGLQWNTPHVEEISLTPSSSRWGLQ
jgi:hypothetical protein